MDTVTLADAKARLSELVERAASGEAVTITRRGKPVARITPIETARKPIDVDRLQALTAAVLGTVHQGSNGTDRRPLIRRRRSRSSIASAV